MECSLLLLLLKHEYEGGEHDGPHPQQEEEQPELLVVSLHCVAESLKTSGMFGYNYRLELLGHLTEITET